MSDTSTDFRGARMLPVVCPADAAPGEREVFRLLQNDSAANDWTVLHSLDLADHVRRAQGEADFVVLIPNEGIIVAEVKSHLSVRLTERGWWLGNSSTPDIRGPFRQSAEALHSIRLYLDQRGLAESAPMISVVIFPNLAFQITSMEWHTWQVLDKQALHARAISSNLLTILQKAREFYSKKNLAWMRNGINFPMDKLAAIVQTLRPRFEVLASPTTRRQSLEEGLTRCTEEQFRVLDDTAINSRLIVSGLAGTGKTTLAIEVVRREKAANPGSIVGFFCFNKFLGAMLAKECASIDEAIRLGSFHSWMVEFAGIKPTADRVGNPEFWNRELPEQCIAKLTAPGMPSGILDLLVLDEAQDLFIDAYLDIFDLLLKGGLRSGRWRFFGDFERQDIFACGAVRKEDFYRERIDERCAFQTLSENCRNTQEISAALTLHARLKPGYSRVLREDSRHDPDIIFYSNEEEQTQSAVRLIEGCLLEGFKPPEIVLLSPHRNASLAQRLQQTEKWRGKMREYSEAPRTLTFTTIHAFKGLEAPVVILTDIHNLDTPGHFDLLYIGMSRALHRLAVLCHDRLREEIKKSCLA